MAKKFQLDNSFTTLGMIKGPAGSGKTYAVRKLCNKYSKGVLYFEITNSRTFVTDIS